MNDSNKSISNLSTAAVKKAVIARAVQSPATVYPFGAAVIGGVYALAVYPSTIALAVMGAGLFSGIGNWVWQTMVKGDENANQFVKDYRKELERRKQQAIEKLHSEFKQISLPEGKTQIELFTAKYQNFVNILDKKLVPGELTYNRYLSIAEQVFLGGLDNLEAAALALHSISAINEKRIKNLLTKETNEDKRTELHARLDMRQKQIERVQSILVNNEKALTQLDQVATKIASINTRQSRAQIALDDAMAELEHLIQRADTYSK